MVQWDFLRNGRRLVRIVRLVRLVRILKLYKQYVETRRRLQEDGLGEGALRPGETTDGEEVHYYH